MPEPIPMDDDAIVAAVLAVRPDAQAIYRFGSTATGYARPDSDVDVAVLVETPLTGAQRLRLMADIDRAVARDGDVMDLARAGSIAHYEVLRDGIKLFENDSRKVGGFEVRSLREFQDLMYYRRDIDAAIVARAFGRG